MPNRNSYFFQSLILLGGLCAGCAASSFDKATGTDGIHVSYHHNGSLKAVEEFRHGKPDGIQRAYDEDGNLKTAKFYENGRLTMLNAYYPEGLLWNKEIYEDGRIIEKIEYDRHGTLIAKDHF